MFVYPYKDGARTGLMVKPVGGFDSSRKRFLSGAYMNICLQDFEASLRTLCASVLAGSFEAQLKKAKEYVTSLALDADKLEDKEKAKFEDGRAIHNSVKNGGLFLPDLCTASYAAIAVVAVKCIEPADVCIC